MSSQDSLPVTDPAVKCAVCPANAIDQPPNTEPRVPPLHLCGEHWADYRTDWLLLGWCDGHYGEALKHCPVHHREISPL